ncbi:MAG: adenosine kinase [Candidatus Azotimanducaceae bacterium]|jgi:adenosine kinase
MTAVLVCGSAAIDFLGSYSGSFKDYEKRYPTAGLNISLQLSRLNTSFGGCGMNITYGLNKLGVPVTPLTSVGLDFRDRYLGHLEAEGVDSRYVCVDESFEHSAHCIIFSDDHGNQITAFNPGASLSVDRVLPRAIPHFGEFSIAMLAPEDAPIMLRQARDIARTDVTVIFDPGQGLAEFKQEEIRELLELSHFVICNDHEWEIMQTNADLSADDIIATHEVIITRGDKGVDLYSAHRQQSHVDAIPDQKIVDPTGCGDAFRAGYIFGMMSSQSPEVCAQYGCVMASTNLSCSETQRYEIDRDLLMKSWQTYYGEAL